MTETRTELNLRNLIRQTITAAPDADITQIAEQVAEQVPADDLREALRQSLGPVVRQVFAEYRPRGRFASNGDASPRPVPMPGFSQAHQPPPALKPVVRMNAKPSILSGSRKGSEIRDAWQRILDSRYATESGFKRVGDCTFDDLQYIAAELDTKAEKYKARARDFRALAALLADHGGEKIDDLPAEVKMQALGSK